MNSNLPFQNQIFCILWDLDFWKFIFAEVIPNWHPKKNNFLPNIRCGFQRWVWFFENFFFDSETRDFLKSSNTHLKVDFPKNLFCMFFRIENSVISSSLTKFNGKIWLSMPWKFDFGFSPIKGRPSPSIPSWFDFFVRL